MWPKADTGWTLPEQSSILKQFNVFSALLFLVGLYIRNKDLHTLCPLLYVQSHFSVLEFFVFSLLILFLLRPWITSEASGWVFLSLLIQAICFFHPADDQVHCSNLCHQETSHHPPLANSCFQDPSSLAHLVGPACRSSVFLGQNKIPQV